jgi:hypothetical protein
MTGLAVLDLSALAARRKLATYCWRGPPLRQQRGPSDRIARPDQQTVLGSIDRDGDLPVP